MQSQLYNLLVEGDKRTVKNVSEAVRLLESNPNLISDVIDFIHNESEALAMRAADCLEKYSRKNAEQLQVHVDMLMDILVEVSQKEVRWHLAQILPRLHLSSDSLGIASKIWFHDYYNSSSNIVRTESLQALYEIRGVYPRAIPDLKKAIACGIDNDTPAVKARASRLFRDL